MNDFLWLNHENESILHDDCNEAIQEANQLFEPGQSEGSIVIRTFTFEQALYLLKAYLEVNLWVHPCGKPFNSYYFISAKHILKELCVRGVLVLSGNHLDSVSLLEFAVVVYDNAREEFLEMLMIIHTLQVNIWVESYKNFDMLGHCSFVDEHAPRLFPINSIHPTYPNVGICGIHLILGDLAKRVEMVASMSHTLFKIRMLSCSHLVEDVFLKYWIRFNTEYGNKNKNIINAAAVYDCQQY